MKEVSKKILPEYFKDVKSGIKEFEVRKDEDDIQVGDILILEEWKPDGVLTGGYTGRCIRKRVKYVLRNIPQYGLQEGYCIIGLEDINNGWIPCSEKLPSKEECGSYGRKEFQVTIPQYGGNKTIAMDYEYSVIRGKEVGRWKWCEKLSPWEVFAWKPMSESYQPKGE